MRMDLTLSLIKKKKKWVQENKDGCGKEGEEVMYESKAMQIQFGITKLIKLSSPSKLKALNLHPILLHTLPLSVPHPSSAAWILFILTRWPLWHKPQIHSIQWSIICVCICSEAFSQCDLCYLPYPLVIPAVWSSSAADAIFACSSVELVEA